VVASSVLTSRRPSSRGLRSAASANSATSPPSLCFSSPKHQLIAWPLTSLPKLWRSRAVLTSICPDGEVIGAGKFDIQNMPVMVAQILQECRQNASSFAVSAPAEDIGIEKRCNLAHLFVLPIITVYAVVADRIEVLRSRQGGRGRPKITQISFDIHFKYLSRILWRTEAHNGA